MTGIEPASPAWKAEALTVVLHLLVQSGRSDSNTRPLGPKPSALPTAPLPVFLHFICEFQSMGISYPLNNIRNTAIDFLSGWKTTLQNAFCIFYGYSIQSLF